MSKRGVKTILAVMVSAGALSGPLTSHAAGFAIIEQSVSGLGNSFAGVAASGEDATDMFYNPANMTQLSGTHYALGAHIIVPYTKFSGSATVSGVVPVSGGNGGDAGQVVAVPNFYYVRDLSPTMKFGLGINAPFGLETEYDRNWVGRYHAVKSQLQTVNINPAIATHINDRLSFGVGLNVQYMRAELTQAVDFAAICTAYSIGSCAGTPTTNDGFSRVKGDDWSWGYNLGLLYEVDPSTRLGAAYRSKMDQKLTGTARFSNTPAALQFANQFVDSNVRADITLPETVMLGAWHRVNARLAVMGGATWTRWSRFQELRIRYDSSQPDTVQPEQWKNSWRYSLGATYEYNSHWTLRGGVAYDETPIPSAALRTPRIPGNNRKWISVGAGYHPSMNVTVDLAYAHLFVSTTPINNTNATASTLSGSFDSHVDIVSAQVQWHFQ